MATSIWRRSWIASLSASFHHFLVLWWMDRRYWKKERGGHTHRQTKRHTYYHYITDITLLLYFDIGNNSNIKYYFNWLAFCKSAYFIQNIIHSMDFAKKRILIFVYVMLNVLLLCILFRDVFYIFQEVGRTPMHFFVWKTTY